MDTAGRSHVTGYAGDELQHFEVATFISQRDGVVDNMTEVWTGIDAQVPNARWTPTEPADEELA